MFRFSIRELLLIAAIVALALTWQLENRRKLEAVVKYEQLQIHYKLVQAEYSTRIRRAEASQKH
jgi:hypothetical protein